MLVARIATTDETGPLNGGFTFEQLVAYMIDDGTDQKRCRSTARHIRHYITQQSTISLV